MKSYKRKFFKEEIRKTFIIYALAPIIILSFLFYNLLFWYSNKIEESNNKKYNNSLANTISKEFGSYKLEVSELAHWEILKGDFYKQSKEAQVYERFYNIVNKHELRSVFYVYNEKGEVIITNSKVSPDYSKNNDLFIWGVFKKMRDNPKGTAMMINRAQLDINTRTVYSIGQAIVSDNGVIKGYVVFDILENGMNTIINMSTSHHAVITDRYNNNIVSSNTGFLDGIGKLKPFLKEDNNYIYSNPILEGNIYVHSITSLNFVKTIYLIGQIFLIILFLILFLSMLFMAKKISISKTKSIDELLAAIKSVQEGNLNTVVNIKSNDEFQLIGQYYNEMLVKINELIEKNKEEVTRSMWSEIKQLEAQFNPHFLFNTLEMLKYMIKTDEENSQKIIVSMSSLLRYSINSNFHKANLIQDIKYIEDFLVIQKFRFDSNFDYAIQLQEETKACIIPKLIIQPIIENSIKHGFKTKTYLKIDINCSVIEENLIIEIRDNGEGISTENLSEILGLMANNDNNTEHLGLYNVQKRIKLLYGNQYGMKINSILGEGTNIIIMLPISSDL